MIKLKICLKNIIKIINLIIITFLLLQGIAYVFFSQIPKRVILALILIFVINTGLTAGDQQAVKRLKEPVPSSEEEKSLISEGINLHDEGKFDNAIEKYQEVLKINPDNVEALYEISFSNYSSKNYKEALKYARRGMEYNSQYYFMHALTAGSALDELGEFEEAVKVLKEAISVRPEESLLHYNLGLTYYQNEYFDEAEEYVINALKINPYHSTSNILLSEIYFQKKLRIQFLYSIMFFLYLEPDTERSKVAWKMFNEIFDTYLKKEGEKKIILSFNSQGLNDAMHRIDMNVSFSLAACEIDSTKNGINCLIESISSATRMAGITGREEFETQTSKFMKDHYIPFYSGLEKAGYLDAFLYLLLDYTGDEIAKDWMDKNLDEVKEMLQWIQDYKWHNN